MARMHAVAVMHSRGMNRVEQQYDRYLRDRITAGEIRWALFEPIKIRLADSTFYTPDFLVVANDLSLEAHEVKTEWSTGKPGWQEDARVKVKVAAELLPIRFVAATLMKDGRWDFEWFMHDREVPREKSIFERLVEIEDRFKAAKFDTDADRNMAWQFVREACGVSDGR